MTPGGRHAIKGSMSRALPTSLLFLASSIALVACGDDDGDTSGVDASVPDSGTVDIDMGGDEVDGGGTDDDGGMAMSCYDEGAALVAPGDSVMLEQEECTTEDVANVYSCIFDAESTVDCEMYGITDSGFDDTATLYGCAECLIVGSTDGPAPAALLATDVAYANVWACQAIASGQAECGIPLSQSVFCAQTACGECTDTETGACIEEALAGICEMIDVPEACQPLLEADIAEECDGADFEELFNNIGDYFCGGRPVRGG